MVGLRAPGGLWLSGLLGTLVNREGRFLEPREPIESKGLEFPPRRSPKPLDVALGTCSGWHCWGRRRLGARGPCHRPEPQHKSLTEAPILGEPICWALRGGRCRAGFCTKDKCNSVRAHAGAVPHLLLLPSSGVSPPGSWGCCPIPNPLLLQLSASRLMAPAHWQSLGSPPARSHPGVQADPESASSAGCRGKEAKSLVAALCSI